MLGPWPQRMVNPVRDYDWGSTTVLARMQGRRPTGRPEAELWMGAHHSGPSGLVQVDASVVPLDEAIEDSPGPLLGSTVQDRYGSRLPFLLKILAIAAPLSIQVHPTAERAASVFHGDSEALGGHRYIDPFAKPELLYALEPVDALCGFRAAPAAAGLLARLGSERAALLRGLLTAGGSDTASSTLLENLLRTMVTWPEDDRLDLVADLSAAARARLAEAGPRDEDGLAAADRRALMWVRRLAARFPADPMVAAPLLLDLLRLDPGQVLFIPAGAPHAYLSGLGVEIMCSSDNVLRAGLTSKEISVDEMLHIVDGDSRPVVDVPFTWLSPNEVAWTPPVGEFQLSRIWMSDPAPVAAFPGIAGPQVLLCTSGPVRVACAGTSLTLRPGESAFVGASASTLSLTGPGEVFRACTGGQRVPSSAA